MADHDILQAIQIIDNKIASLLEARNQLAQAFGIESKPANAAAVTAAARVIATPHHGPVQSSSNGSIGHEPSGRKVELAKFLATHGAASRATIIEKAGLPEGTISYCLNDKRFFQQLADGHWAITDYSTRRLDCRCKTGTFQPEAH